MKPEPGLQDLIALALGHLLRGGEEVVGAFEHRGRGDASFLGESAIDDHTGVARRIRNAETEDVAPWGGFKYCSRRNSLFTWSVVTTLGSRAEDTGRWQTRPTWFVAIEQVRRSEAMADRSLVSYSAGGNDSRLIATLAFTFWLYRSMTA